MLNHKFTSREKTLLCILVVLLLALLYKVAVWDYVENTVTQVRQNISIAEDQYKIEQTKLKNLEEMQKALDKKGENKVASEIPKYDNLSNIIIFLNGVLSDTSGFNLNFGKITESGSLVRRSLSISFTALDYDRTVEILGEIYACPYRCSIGDVTIAPVNSNGDITIGKVSVKLTVTFVETKK